MVHTQRTTTAASATASVTAISCAVASRSNSLASRRVMLAIIVMFAASDTHWQATLPAMYFLLSLTVPISLLFIIMRNNLELVSSNR